MNGLEQLLQLNNLGGNFKELYSAVQNGQSSMAFCLSRPHKAHISSHLDKFVLYIVNDPIEATSAIAELSNYYGDRVKTLLPNDDLLIYRKSFHKSNVGARIKTLFELSNGAIDCCVATMSAVGQFLPKVDRLKASVVTLEVGKNYDIYDVAKLLAEMGFAREDAIEEKNTFCLVGDILSIFPSDYDLPIRISFFDDTIESIKYFEPESLMSTGSIDIVQLLPSNDLLWSAQEIDSALQRATAELKKLSHTAADRAEQIIDDIRLEGGCSQKCQWLAPFLTKAMSTIFDYLPQDAVIVFDEPTMLDNSLNLLLQENISRVANLSLDGDCLKAHTQCFLEKGDLYDRFGRFCKLGFSKLVTTNFIFSPAKIFSFEVGILSNYNIHFQSFFDDVKAFVAKGFMVVVCAGDEYKAKAIVNSLIEEKIFCKYCDDIECWQELVAVTSRDISHGFVYNACKLAIIGREDIYKQRLIKEEKKNKVFTIPKVGDYVVHEVHGIGRCLGTDRIKTGNIEQDYVIVEYRNAEKLFVPIDQLDRLSRYSGSDNAPRLSLIGGKDFEKVKENVKRSVKEMAINLVELYARRQQKSGYKYEKDTEWQQQFENSFEFEE
ncbi:MAG: CarD family transcriptional regulator, partial [Clostridia bacterium]